MGNLDEFSLPTRLFLKAYPWRRVDPVPWTVLSKPIAASCVAIASSAGFVAPGQADFDSSIKGGDTSFREISGDQNTAELRETHRSGSFDHAGVQSDPNLGFPLDRLREMAAAGEIGGVSARHLSFMGSIVAPGRLVRDTAPAAVKRLVEARVDVALLVPV